MKWDVYDETVLYDNPWVRLTTVDVDVPGVGRIDHHVVRATSSVVGTVVTDPQRGVLLMWRHRFITDEWGWEIPAGRVDAGESLPAAAERETIEETGWRPHELRFAVEYFPSDGLSDQRFSIFVASGATHLGPPTDISESERLEWHSLTGVRELLQTGQIRNGLSMTALLWTLTMQPPKGDR